MIDVKSSYVMLEAFILFKLKLIFNCVFNIGQIVLKLSAKCILIYFSETKGLA